MKKIKLNKSKIVVFLIILNVLFIAGTSFAFWASSIAGDTDQTGTDVNVGHWGTPIFTAQEFFNFATKTNSVATDEYYLANNIDFTGFTWEITSSFHNTVFYGTLNGNNKTLSNLTIFNNNITYRQVAIFPRINGGRVFNLTLDNVHIRAALGGNRLRSALISGTAIGGVIDLSNITVLNSSVFGSSSGGTGGLIARVQNVGTIVNINNVKLSNLNVFNASHSVGGLVGFIHTNTTLNISDVNFQGSVYSNNIASNSRLSNAGGLIGSARTGSHATIDRVIVDATFQNKVPGTPNYLGYSNRRLGGFIGTITGAASSNITIDNAFFTGNLFVRINGNRNHVGTAVGNGFAVLTNVYHSQVSYRDASGNPTFTTGSPLGTMATIVNEATMPSPAWWDNFATSFLPFDNAWSQDPVTRRLILNT